MAKTLVLLFIACTVAVCYVTVVAASEDSTRDLEEELEDFQESLDGVIHIANVHCNNITTFCTSISEPSFFDKEKAEHDCNFLLNEYICKAKNGPEDLKVLLDFYKNSEFVRNGHGSF